jgi:MFS transporter, DHA2 family, multidrug resistance protein
MLDRGEHNDWFGSRETVAELIVALCALWIFFIHTRSVAHPLFSRNLIRDRNFLMALLFMIILGIVNVGLSAVLPTMYQNVYGYGVMDTGVLMAPRGFGVLTTMLITQRLMGKVDTRIVLSLGYGIAAVSLWTMTRWSLDMGKDWIMISGFIQGMGLGFIFLPANMVAFSTLSSRFRTDGMTLMNLFRNLGSSFGISVIVTILGRNIQTSHADIAASVTSFNVPAIDPATTAGMMGNAGETAMAMLNGEVSRQAAMVAYLDNFYMMFWVMLCVVPLAWLLKKPRPIGALDQIHIE